MKVVTRSCALLSVGSVGLNHLSLNEGGHPSADRSPLWGPLKSILFNTLRLFIRLFFLTEIRLYSAHGA